MRLTFLGTGTSFGVPQIGCDCAVCRSSDPRDKRTRSGAVLEAGDSTILIDTPPELRLQLISAGFSHIDAVLYTHEHADHINGIDDLRIFSVRPYEGTSKPRLVLNPITPGQVFTSAGVETMPLAFQHGHIRVFGYRFGKLAYLTDIKAIPQAELEQLKGLEVLVLNALWWRPHPTHLSISEAIETARILGAGRTYLTHLTHETGHSALESTLPPGVFAAYDGLTVEVP